MKRRVLLAAAAGLLLTACGGGDDSGPMPTPSVVMSPKLQVIHASPDDYASDPAGNAGDRIACGVIVR